MESMRAFPIFFFFMGLLFVYAGLTNRAPLDILRDNVRAFQDDDASDDGYGVTDDPFYGGVPLYSNPNSRRSAGGF